MRNVRRWGSVASALAIAAVIAACGGSSSSSSSAAGASPSASSSSSGAAPAGGSVTLTGAGSTLAAPIYQQWGSNLSSQGLSVNYQATGSGGGIAQLQSGTVDFAGSDPPMKPSEIAAAKGPVQHFPVAFGAITVSYHLSGVKSGIKLDGKTVADIFLGKVTKWNDPEIKAANAGVSLPSMPITVIHRSDSSGTTKGFTTFLSDYSPAWTAAAGEPDKVVKWPTGTGAKGNAGVAASIQQTAGAIGYVDQAFALQSNLTFASVKNHGGQFIAPTLPATSAAAVGIKVPPDLTVSTINSPNPAAYPIVSQTFVIVYKDLCKAGVSKTAASGLKKFLTYGLGAGQAVEAKLGYAPLPSSIAKLDVAALGKLTCSGSPLS
ncbi:MAG: phosphate ABC transporter substrate-binding protein PstS [Actinomycetota bacterium]|nr:phosphate ABC transporter substrate-binding protein PstS [Actinomycetota bacterium]